MSDGPGQTVLLLTTFADDVFGSIARETLVPLVHWMHRHTQLNVWLNQQLFKHDETTGELSPIVCDDFTQSDRALESVKKK